MQSFKKLFVLILILSLCQIAKGQGGLPKGLPITTSTGWIRYGYLQSDSGQIIAARDTNFVARFVGTMVYWAHAGHDTAVWVFNGRTTGKKWFSLTGGGSVSPADTNFVNNGAVVVHGTKDTIQWGGFLIKNTTVTNNSFWVNFLSSGLQSTAIGNTALASGISSGAYGDNAQAIANYAFAFGQNSLASGVRSTAAGNMTDATGVSSGALFDNAQALADSCAAIGWHSIMQSKYGIAIGDSALAQPVIGRTRTTPSAKFEIFSTTGGLLIPRMTSTQRDAIVSPVDGLLIYNTTTKTFNYYNVTAVAWVGITNGAANIYNSDGVFTGDRIVDAGTHNFSISNIGQLRINSNAGNDIQIYVNGVGGRNGVIAVDDTAASMQGRGPTGGFISQINVRATGIDIKPNLGDLFIDTLRNAVGTKALRYNVATGLVSYADTTTGGGGGGGVTSVATGLGLSGGTITSTGTLLLDTSYAVTKTSAQTISGAKTFTSDVNITKATALLNIRNTDVNSFGGFSLYKSDNTHVDFGLNSSGAGGDQYLFTNSAIPYKWYNQGALRMQIDANGNVGIGATAPGALLDVANGLLVDPLVSFIYKLGAISGGQDSRLSIDDANTVDTLMAAGVDNSLIINGNTHVTTLNAGSSDNQIVLNGATPSAKTRLGGVDYLRLNPSTLLYEFGDIDNTVQGNKLKIDDDNGIITLGNAAGNGFVMDGGLQVIDYTASSGHRFTGLIKLNTVASGALIDSFLTLSASGEVRQVYNNFASTKANILLTAQHAAVSSVATYTTPADGRYTVGGNVNVTAISAGALSLQVTYTDENNSSTTTSFITGISATGHNNPAPIIINAKSGTTITVLTTFSGVSVTYSVAGVIQAL